MRRRILFILLSAVIATSSCSDELKPSSNGTDVTELDESGLEEVALNLSVKEFSVDSRSGTRASEPSDVPEIASDEEKAVHNIWVFQYDALTEKLLIKPRYYTIGDQSLLNNLPVHLRIGGGRSIIYVVANTGDTGWAAGDKWTQFNTLNQLKGQSLPNPLPIQAGKVDVLSIPMGGSSGEVEVTAVGVVVVPVASLYAKLKIKNNITVSGMSLFDIDVAGIPEFCQIESLVKEVDGWGEPLAVTYPDNTQFISRAFEAADEDEEEWVTIYVPENIQGENANNPGADKSDDVPAKALSVIVQTEYNGGRLSYTVYPGGNNYSNFNIQRNKVYRVVVNINTATDQHKPSSNCYIVKPGGLVSFEPYNRVETGGGYDIKSYLNPEVESLSIHRVGIIWQTKDCIGDNSDEQNPLVWLGEGSGEHRKIYVRAQKEGNALIAAYNKAGQVLWSWHIWVTGNEPDNLGKAVTYTTYEWDEKGIYSNRRISGNAVMSCNLGAMADEQSGTAGNGTVLRYPAEQTTAFGMLYQWGRKDPFPPLRTRSNPVLDYNDTNTDVHYDNSNQQVVHKTAGDDASYLFHSVVGNNISGAVRYAVANPTVFISGTYAVKQRESYVGNRENYFNTGDWCPPGESDNKLWGGLEPAAEGMKTLVIDNRNVHLSDNYGTKSIFDPCPSGWRVAPAELWLGFTKTGLNPKSMDEINYKDPGSKSFGMHMYMEAWRTGQTSYFPTQGARVGDGMGLRVGDCGNYHNATTDTNNRVNILHIHDAANLFHIFEYTYFMYYVKSVAGPVRCVRESR